MRKPWVPTIFNLQQHTGAQALSFCFGGRGCALVSALPPIPPPAFFIWIQACTFVYIYFSTYVFRYSPFKSSNSYADMHKTLTPPHPPHHPTQSHT